MGMLIKVKTSSMIKRIKKLDLETGSVTTEEYKKVYVDLGVKHEVIAINGPQGWAIVELENEKDLDKIKDVLIEVFEDVDEIA